MQLNTHHKSFFQFFNYVFLSLSAAILAVILLCGIIFHRLYSSVEQVVQVTVPSINRIADVGNNARTLSTLIPRIKQINNQADLNLIGRKLILQARRWNWKFHS